MFCTFDVHLIGTAQYKILKKIKIAINFSTMNDFTKCNNDF